MKLTIKMPSDLDCHRMAIRGLWLAYDHYSIEANSYRMPQLPENLFDLWNPSLGTLCFSTQFSIRSLVIGNLAQLPQQIPSYPPSTSTLCFIL